MLSPNTLAKTIESILNSKHMVIRNKEIRIVPRNRRPNPRSPASGLSFNFRPGKWKKAAGKTASAAAGGGAGWETRQKGGRKPSKSSATQIVI